MSEIVEALRELRKLAEEAGAKNRAEGEKLVREIVRRRKRIKKEFWEIGTALARLAEPAMYLSMGFKSFAQLLAGRELFGRSHAHRLVEVAKTFTREQALALGAEKAFALARYVAATPEDDLAGAMVDEDAPIGGKPVSAMSLRDLEAATKSVRQARANNRAKDPLERGARAAARAAQAALRRLGAEGARATVLRERGSWIVRVDLSVAAASAIARA